MAAMDEDTGAAQQGSSVLQTALAYHRAGLAVLPIRPDGSKAPALPAGHPFLRRAPTEADLQRWFSPGRNGIGIVCGRVSGQLETLDFETWEIYQTWVRNVEEQLPGLVARLCWVRTPGHLGQPGLHARYRCPDVCIPGSTLLACAASPEDGSRPRVLIETRGEGGYAIAPGSPAACHPAGGTWEHQAGSDLCHLPSISAQERDVLIGAARALDQRKRARRKASTPAGSPQLQEDNQGAQAPCANSRDGLSPGAIYNLEGPDWAEILCPHGWQQVRSMGAVRYWRRPGKAEGWSATTGYCHGNEDIDLFHVFSSNSQPFEQGRSYSKFNAYVLLNHQGDYQAAIQHLRQQTLSDPPGEPATTTRDNDDPLHLIIDVLTLLRNACARAACWTTEDELRFGPLLERLAHKQVESIIPQEAAPTT